MVESSEGYEEPKDGDLSAVLDATLALSQTQLLAQIADETSLDGRTMGILGFNGALVAADIAAKGLLGSWWWMPLPFVLIATLLCARSVFAKDTFLGPEALTFFANYGGQSSKLARETLLADLDVAYQSNSDRAREKTASLRGALTVLALGLAVSGSLIVFDKSSKVAHRGCSLATQSTACSAATRPHPGAVRSAASGAARNQKIGTRP
jgi:hypothetical protein